MGVHELLQLASAVLDLGDAERDDVEVEDAFRLVGFLGGEVPQDLVLQDGELPLPLEHAVRSLLEKEGLQLGQLRLVSFNLVDLELLALQDLLIKEEVLRLGQERFDHLSHVLDVVEHHADVLMEDLLLAEHELLSRLDLVLLPELLVQLRNDDRALQLAVQVRALLLLLLLHVLRLADLDLDGAVHRRQGVPLLLRQLENALVQRVELAIHYSPRVRIIPPGSSARSAPVQESSNAPPHPAPRS